MYFLETVTNPDWIIFIQTALIQLLRIAFMFALGYIANYFKQKTESKAVEDAIARAQRTAERVVNYTEQEFVKAAKINNTWNDKAKKEAFNMALEAALNSLSKESYALLKENFGNVKDYFEQLIEEQVSFGSGLTFCENVEQETVFD